MTSPPISTVEAERIRWQCAPASATQPAQTQLRGLRIDAARLSGSRALLAGVGGTGGPLAEACVRLGLALTIVDPDEFGPESWRTQSCTAADAGRGKAEVVLERLHTINPYISLAGGRGWLQNLPWQCVQQVDLLLSAGDNLALVVALGRLAAAFGKPLVQAAVHGESLSVIVRRWDLREADGACPACALSAADWSALAVRRGCDLKATPVGGTVPTQTVPFVCVAAGQLAAAEAVRCLSSARLAAGASETLLTLETFQTFTTPLDRQLNCRCEHVRWRVEPLTRPPEETTIQDVQALSPFTRATKQSVDVDVFSELPWCSYTSCVGCGRWRPIGRFADYGDTVGQCACGASLTATAQGLRRVIPRADVVQFGGQPLSQLGLPSGRALVLDDGESAPWCAWIGPLEQPYSS